uniref:Uncharacterized protein n=1 Tax=Zonotrichia albicollis TaxID=44394 RepID=A0A8D2MDJ6_ZONAL
MRGFQRGSQLLTAALRMSRVPRAHLGTAMPLIPAPCPPQEQAVAFSLMFSSFLVPTAWVLSNIYNYRSRPE